MPCIALWGKLDGDKGHNAPAKGPAHAVSPSFSRRVARVRCPPGGEMVEKSGRDKSIGAEE